MDKKFNPENIKQGDYIDFGVYGKLYVCDPSYDSDRFRVTDIKKDRKNFDASGWNIKKVLAIGKAK